MEETFNQNLQPKASEEFKRKGFSYNKIKL